MSSRSAALRRAGAVVARKRNATSGVQKTQGMQRLGVPSDFPFGTQKVDKLAPSTGIYGKRATPVTDPLRAVRVRGVGKRGRR